MATNIIWPSARKIRIIHRILRTIIMARMTKMAAQSGAIIISGIKTGEAIKNQKNAAAHVIPKCGVEKNRI